MRTTELRVKIKTLADEARHIRLEERRAKAARRRHALRQDQKAAERARWQLVDLQYHRRKVVRRAARRNLLAYAFIRGRPYHQLETNPRTDPKWGEVAKDAARFSGKPVTKDDMEAWAGLRKAEAS